jgi:hypothetical protein
MRSNSPSWEHAGNTTNPTDSDPNPAIAPPLAPKPRSTCETAALQRDGFGLARLELETERGPTERARQSAEGVGARGVPAAFNPRYHRCPRSHSRAEPLPEPELTAGARSRYERSARTARGGRTPRGGAGYAPGCARSSR